MAHKKRNADEVSKISTKENHLSLHKIQNKIDELRDFYDFSPVGYLTVNSRGQILSANLTAGNMLGVIRKELIGRRLFKFIDSEDKDILLLHLKKIFKSRNPQTCELRLKDGSGGIFYAALGSIYDKDRESKELCKTVLTDISERVQTELALKDNEEKFRLIAETSPDIIFQLSPDEGIIYCSPSVQDILGYTPEEVKDTFFETYLFSTDVPRVRKNFRKLIRGERVFSLEIDVLSKHGTSVPLEVNAAPLVINGRTEFIYGIARNITERKQAEEAIRHREEHLRLAVEGGNLGTWEYDLINNKIFWNTMLYELVGRNPELPITTESFFEYIHPDDFQRVRRKVEEAVNTGSDYRDEFRIIREDGEERWLGASGTVYQDAEGQPARMAGINYDITVRKRMEDALRRAYDEMEKRVEDRTRDMREKTENLDRLNIQLRDQNEQILLEQGWRRYLSKQLVRILEKERRDLAMALHDGAGQILATLKMDLDMMESMTAPEKQADLLNSVRKKLADLIDFVRNTSKHLRPSVLDTLGLLPAIRSLVDQVKNQSPELDIVFFSRDVPETLDTDKQTALFRIIQEAMTNIMKYAAAEKVHINLLNREDTIFLTIEDDGRGFDYDKISALAAQGKGPTGITIMRERAVQQDGSFWIESTPGRGTFISVEVPIA